MSTVTTLTACVVCNVMSDLTFIKFVCVSVCVCVCVCLLQNSSHSWLYSCWLHVSTVKLLTARVKCKVTCDLTNSKCVCVCVCVCLLQNSSRSWLYSCWHVQWMSLAIQMDEVSHICMASMCMARLSCHAHETCHANRSSIWMARWVSPSTWMKSVTFVWHPCAWQRLILQYKWDLPYRKIKHLYGKMSLCIHMDEVSHLCMASMCMAKTHRGIRMSLTIHMDEAFVWQHESWHTHGWSQAHIRWRHEYEGLVAFLFWEIVLLLFHTCKYFMSHVWTQRVTHANQACHTHNESWHTYVKSHARICEFKFLHNTSETRLWLCLVLFFPTWHIYTDTWRVKSHRRTIHVTQIPLWGGYGQ